MASSHKQQEKEDIIDKACFVTNRNPEPPRSQNSQG
jgi:hypothetical protein